MSGIPEDARFEEPELACMLENLQKGRKGLSKGFRRVKKGWSKGESRGGLKLSTKEAGKGGRPENYKQHRLKLQSDRLNKGWRDQPAHGTNKGRGRPQLAQVDHLLARTLCFKCGALGHLAKDCPQNNEPTTNSETFFSGMVCNDSCTVHPRHDFCADHSRDNSRLVFLETNPALTLILATGCELKVTVKEMTKLSSVFEKMMFPFSMSKQMVSAFLFLVRAQTYFSLGSVVVVGHVRDNVGTRNWNQVVGQSTTRLGHL